VAGKTAILMAPSVLHINITSNIVVSGNAIKLPIEDLHNYVPFSHNISINDRLRIFTFTPDKEFEPVKEDDDDDRYIVIIKQFNARLGQYEFFFVKWKGYSDTTLGNLLQAFLMTL